MTKKMISRIHPFCLVSRLYSFLQNDYCKRCFGEFGKGARVFGKIIAYSPENISVGDFSTLNEGVVLNARTKIRIGCFVHISPSAQVHTAGLQVLREYGARRHYSKEVIIEDGCWICSGAIISPGVTLGEGCVILPGAVVTHNVPAYEMWGGVPARFVKTIDG